MTFTEILEKRRSIRKFQDTEVLPELVRQIIRESTLAPSAGNEQPWEFIIVCNRSVIERISNESKKNILHRIASNPDDYAKKYENMLQNEGFNIFYDAPAIVLILGKADAKNLYADCALAACYLMMSAVSKGLGTCWVNFGTEIYDPELRDVLGIPENYTVVAPMALGYPETIPGTPRRKEPRVRSL